MTALLRFMCLLILLVCVLFPLTRTLGRQVSAGEIVYQADIGVNSDIRLLDVRTAITLPITRTPDVDEQRPVWLPDGTAIVFNEQDSNGVYRLQSVDLVTAARTTLIALTEPVCCLTWSPDGTQIAYMRSFGELILRDLTTDEETFLAYGFEPNWSPLDDQIIYHMRVQELERTQILRISESDMSVSRQITAIENDSFAPQWSPDGRWIAFVSNRANLQRVNDIYIVPSDCVSPPDCLAKTRQLTTSEANFASPAWSPDGQWLAYSYGVPGGVQLYALHIETGEQRRLTYDDAINLYPAWGRR